MAHTPSNKHKAKYIKAGRKINLCFFINLGKLVNVNASINEDNTIQNHDNVPSIAKLQIKQVIIVIT